MLDLRVSTYSLDKEEEEEEEKTQPMRLMEDEAVRRGEDSQD